MQSGILAISGTLGCKAADRNIPASLLEGLSHALPYFCQDAVHPVHPTSHPTAHTLGATCAQSQHAGLGSD